MAENWGKGCSHPGCPEIIRGEHWLCETHRKQRQKVQAREIRQKNPLEQKFYNSAEWERLSRALRAKEPNCRECAKQGRDTFADLIDHIIPLQIAWHMRFDKTNLQPMCHSCHNRKRQLERAMYENTSTAKPCVIVCGPPGSGKTTFVKERAKPEDLIVDADSIFTAISINAIHSPRPECLLPIVLEVKAAIIHRAFMMGVDRPAMWLITSGASKQERQQYQKMFNAKVVILARSVQVCVDRIAHDSGRAHLAEATRNIIEAWWNKYEPTEGDQIIEDG